MGTVKPPTPDEKNLTVMVERTVAFPGRVMTFAMSEWHWEMVEFLALWNEQYQRDSILHDYFKVFPDRPEKEFADLSMLALRDLYNVWTKDLAPGEVPEFTDPRV